MAAAGNGAHGGKRNISAEKRSAANKRQHVREAYDGAAKAAKQQSVEMTISKESVNEAYRGGVNNSHQAKWCMCVKRTASIFNILSWRIVAYVSKISRWHHTGADVMALSSITCTL